MRVVMSSAKLLHSQQSLLLQQHLGCLDISSGAGLSLHRCLGRSLVHLLANATSPAKEGRSDNTVLQGGLEPSLHPVHGMSVSLYWDWKAG